MEPLYRHPITLSRAIYVISLNILLLLIGAGSVYGYNALRPVLIADGAHADLCEEGETNCDEQKLALNLVETLCFFVVDVIALPCGFLLDSLGLRALTMSFSCLYGVGFGFLAVASQLKIHAFYLIGLIAIAAAPIGTYIVALASAKMLQDTSKTFYISSLVALSYEVSPMFMFLLSVVVPTYLSFPFSMMIFCVATTTLSLLAGMRALTVQEARDIDRFNKQNGSSANVHGADAEANANNTNNNSNDDDNDHNNNGGGKDDNVKMDHFKQQRQNYGSMILRPDTHGEEVKEEVKAEPFLEPRQQYQQYNQPSSTSSTPPSSSASANNQGNQMQHPGASADAPAPTPTPVITTATTVTSVRSSSTVSTCSSSSSSKTMVTMICHGESSTMHPRPQQQPYSKTASMNNYHHEEGGPKAPVSTPVSVKNATIDNMLQQRGINKTDGAEAASSPSLWTLVLQPRYLLHLLFMGTINTRLQFYVATFTDQMVYFATPEEVKHMNNIFNIGFFVSAIIVTPIMIGFFHVCKGRFDIIFLVLWAMAITHAVLNTFMRESYHGQILAMMLFFVLKPLKWAAAAEFLHHAPYQLSMYGRLYGIVNITCGAGALSIYPLTKMSFQYFEGSFFVANLLLTTGQVLAVSFPLYLTYEYAAPVLKKTETINKNNKLSCIVHS
mmetsp:Transcript_466/g.689  ORF Transcript_466/g.689 Transcript_466/m.689 type:complete len:670 (-) Transcript_466:255-2264(-)